MSADRAGLLDICRQLKTWCDDNVDDLSTEERDAAGKAGMALSVLGLSLLVAHVERDYQEAKAKGRRN